MFSSGIIGKNMDTLPKTFVWLLNEHYKQLIRNCMSFYIISEEEHHPTRLTHIKCSLYCRLLHNLKLCLINGNFSRKVS